MPSEDSYNKSKLGGNANVPVNHTHQNSIFMFQKEFHKIGMLVFASASEKLILELGQVAQENKQVVMSLNNNGTWMMMAALVCFRNLNSLRAVIALKPVCNVIADDRTVKYDFLAIYRLKFFWIFRAAASRLNCSYSLQAILPTKKKKRMQVFQKPQ